KRSSHHKDAIENHWQKKDAPFHLPGHTAEPIECQAAQGAQDKATRPACMENVQPMCLIQWKERRRQWVDDCLASAVGQREAELAQVKAPVCSFLALRLKGEWRGHGETDREHVQQKSDNHQPAIADYIGEKTECDGGDAEAN